MPRGEVPTALVGIAVFGCQMRMGMTTYLKSSLSGSVMSAELLPSDKLRRTMSWFMLVNTSMR